MEAFSDRGQVFHFQVRPWNDGHGDGRHDRQRLLPQWPQQLGRLHHAASLCTVHCQSHSRRHQGCPVLQDTRGFSNVVYYHQGRERSKDSAARDAKADYGLSVYSAFQVVGRIGFFYRALNSVWGLLYFVS